MKATNRQLKILRFFNLRFSDLTAGRAGFIIGQLDESRLEIWRKYLYKYNDFENSPLTKDGVTFTSQCLVGVEIPPDWCSKKALREWTKNLYGEGDIFSHFYGDIEGKIFSVTGSLAHFEARAEIINVLEGLGGSFKKGVSRETDFLIVGEKGSKAWANKGYGAKIENALRKEVSIVKESDILPFVK